LQPPEKESGNIIRGEKKGSGTMSSQEAAQGLFYRRKYRMKKKEEKTRNAASSKKGADTAGNGKTPSGQRSLP